METGFVNLAHDVGKWISPGIIKGNVLAESSQMKVSRERSKQLEKEKIMPWVPHQLRVEG